MTDKPVGKASLKAKSSTESLLRSLTVIVALFLPAKTPRFESGRVLAAKRIVGHS